MISWLTINSSAIQLANGKTARYEENAPHAKAKPKYEVGQKVSVTYQPRSLPFGKEKILITQIRFLGSPSNSQTR